MIMLINHYEFITTYQLIDEHFSWYISLNCKNIERINKIINCICESNALAILFSRVELKELKYLSAEIHTLCKIKLKNSVPIIIERKYNYG